MSNSISSRIGRSVSRISLALVLLLVIAPIGFGTFVWLYSLTLRSDLDARFPPPGQMVKLDTHSLHIKCTGTRGNHTVILEAGAGGWSTYWGLVQNRLPNSIRVCSYDRAGLGWSNKGPLPRDDSTIVRELHQLLSNTGEQPPYILVGHSGGGPLAWFFAAEHPEEVSGLVLVDSVTPGYRQREDESASPLKSFVRTHLRPLLFLQETTSRVLSPPDYSSAMYEAYSQFQRDAFEDAGFRTRMISSSVAERAHHGDLGHMAAAGELPLIVIEAGIVHWPISEKSWRLGQKEILAESSRSKHLIAHGVGHSIPRDAPEIVIEAILSTIELANQ